MGLTSGVLGGASFWALTWKKEKTIPCAFSDLHSFF